MHDLKKEAQRRAIRLAPRRLVGKWIMKKRSSEVYAKAMDALDKTDDFIRKAAYRQKDILNKMDKYKEQLATNNFAILASRFKKEQSLINKAIDNLNNVFVSIAKTQGTDDIDEAINISIGATPRDKQIEESTEADVEDYEEKMMQGLDINASTNEQLRKEALFRDYWRKQTQSGKAYYQSFKDVYKIIENMFKSNVSLLKVLDEQRSIGDPGSYYRKAKSGFKNFDNEMKSCAGWSRFTNVLKRMDEQRAAQQQEKEKTEEHDKPQDVKPAISAPISQENIPKVEAPAPAPTPEPPDQPADKPPEQLAQTPPAQPAVKDLQEKNPTKLVQDSDKPEEPKTAINHSLFIEKIADKTNAGYSEEDIARFMLKYAEKIKYLDYNYSIELTKIAKGVLNGK